MRKFILSLLIISSFFLLFKEDAYSQQRGELSVEVVAILEKLSLSVSGFASPYAKIDLTSLNEKILSTTKADQNGNFSFLNVSINKGFSGFCLKTSDQKNLGTSTACINIPPATENTIKNNIFIPPTLEVRLPIVAGYTMPGALVTLYIDGKVFLTTSADNNGYYEFKIKNLTKGKHKVYTSAKYKNFESLIASKHKEMNFSALEEETKRKDSGKIERIKEVFQGRNLIILIAFIIVCAGIIIAVKIGWVGRLKSIIDKSN